VQGLQHARPRQAAPHLRARPLRRVQVRGQLAQPRHDRQQRRQRRRQRLQRRRQRGRGRAAGVARARRRDRARLAGAGARGRQVALRTPPTQALLPQARRGGLRARALRDDLLAQARFSGLRGCQHVAAAAVGWRSQRQLACVPPESPWLEPASSEA